ncbi:uncharacterized protein LOC108675989 [Hyalella azteca]|uniref:Uncharacterized protein LOC108675989 n=1 Tax=Hyalella azteca TaxID=294128 RepID=A0A8B7P0I5_HYAAZ|nr:uncharacterized protein LOC108675989 [Hyalella azteca]
MGESSLSRRGSTKQEKRSRSVSAGRNPHQCLRAQHWGFFFCNLQQAVDQIYQTCETDESVIECTEAILMLERYTKDFRKLIEWLQIKWEYENTPPPQRPTSLAWEQPKMRSAGPQPQVRAPRPAAQPQQFLGMRPDPTCHMAKSGSRSSDGKREDNERRKRRIMRDDVQYEGKLGEIVDLVIKNGKRSTGMLQKHCHEIIELSENEGNRVSTMAIMTMVKVEVKIENLYRTMDDLVEGIYNLIHCTTLIKNEVKRAVIKHSCSATEERVENLERQIKELKDQN